jgi:Translation initiation factor 1 (eIF-1/SUI1) and related proteins
MAAADWKERLGVVYSTNSDFHYQNPEQEQEPETLLPGKQKLLVGIDRRQRAGKQVTLISGFIGSTPDIEALGKLLKQKCGVGGSVKDGLVIIQGDFRDKIVGILQAAGYQVKRSN